jgi:hypothetical protein
MLFTMTLPAIVSQATPSPVPSPSATPNGPSDPCTTILAFVNRPTITSSVCVVKPRDFEVETGFTDITTTGPLSGTTQSYPQSFLRYGLTTHVELDVTPPSETTSSFGGHNVDGLTDPAIGFKDELGYNARASWGFGAQVSVPAGGRFTNTESDYTGTLNGSYAFGSVFGVASTLGFDSLASGNSRYFAYAPSVVLQMNLPQQTQAFVEYAESFPTSSNVGVLRTVDMGFEHSLSAHFLGDIEYGFSPAQSFGTRTHYVGFGLSFLR